jgi:hypothetical protein
MTTLEVPNPSEQRHRAEANGTTVLMALEMLGAIVATGHYQALSGSVLAGALILAAVGAGRYSVDHAVAVRTTSAPEARTRPK